MQRLKRLWDLVRRKPASGVDEALPEPPKSHVAPLRAHEECFAASRAPEAAKHRAEEEEALRAFLRMEEDLVWDEPEYDPEKVVCYVSGKPVTAAELVEKYKSKGPHVITLTGEQGMRPWLMTRREREEAFGAAG